MLRVLGRGSKLCDGVSRRELLQAGALSTLGLTLPQFLHDRAAAAGPPAGSAKAVILVNLLGGPSHIDMFDMKPQAPVEIRGEFDPIDTSLPGLQICEHLPLTAQTMHLSSLIRTHTHLYNTHSPYNLLTGYSGPVIVNNLAKSTDHPAFSSVYKLLRPSKDFIDSAIHVNAPAIVDPNTIAPGQFGGFLGREYDPMIVGDVTDQSLKEMDIAFDEGVTSFKMFMAYPGVLMVEDGGLFKAMRLAGGRGAMICVHAENGPVIKVLVEEAVAQGHTAPKYHRLTRPSSMEGCHLLIFSGSIFPVVSRRYFFVRFSNAAIHSCAIAWAFVIWDGFNSLAARSRYAAPLSLPFAAAI